MVQCTPTQAMGTHLMHSGSAWIVSICVTAAYGSEVDSSAPKPCGKV